jgi:plastocyanin
MFRARFPLLALAVLALAFAGCGDDDDDDGGGGGSAQSSAPTGGGGGETVKLSETDFKITPASPSVSQPGEVTFAVTNDGNTDHALEVEGPGEEQETDTIAPGDSANLKVDLSKDGTFEFYCPIGNHKEMGMEGQITVGKGGPVASGGEDEEKSEDESDDSGGGGGY